MMSIARLLLGLILWLQPVAAIGQLKCELPNIKGVASIRTEGRMYLAIWRHTAEKDLLDIYDSHQCTESSRVASFEDTGIWWQSLSAIEDGAIVGFQVRTTVEEGWYGATKLFMYDGKKFNKSYASGEISEVTDLNGDGFPEVLEFLGNKGDPTGKVRVHVWRGSTFDMLTTVTANKLYSSKLIALLNSRESQSRADPYR
ncbi:MAG: FG-GAP repeat protein [Terriglobia bacterium]